MKKRISCKVIRSVPLGKNAARRQRTTEPNGRVPMSQDVASLTYTRRLVVTRLDIDNGLTAQLVDFCV